MHDWRRVGSVSLTIVTSATDPRVLSERVNAAADAARAAGVDALLLTPGADLRYLVGYAPGQIQMPSNVVLVAQPMFPVAMLPEAALRPCPPPLRHERRVVAGFTQLMGDIPFDQSPSRRVVVIAGGQGPDGMKVVRQKHPALDPEGPLPAHGLDRLPQRKPGSILRQEPLPPLGDHGEEERSPGDKRSTILRHERATFGIRRL